MNKTTTIVTILLVLVLIALGVVTLRNRGAVGNENPPNSAEGAPPGSLHNLPVPEPVRSARAALAARLDIATDKVLILEAQETDWSDSCLGLGGPAESCLQAITPGYAVRLQAGGQEYSYRTDLTGQVVRAEN